MRKAGFVAFITMIIACAHSTEAPPPPSTYQVVIDDSFTDQDRSSVAGGFDAWSSAVGRDLSFQYITESADNIQAGLQGTPPKGTIYAIHTDDLSSVDCVLMASNVACYRSPNRIYYQPDAIAAINAWKKIAVHEAGHALGLQHTNITPSVMVLDILSMADAPTSTDVDTYCSLQPLGCPNRPSDKKTTNP